MKNIRSPHFLPTAAIVCCAALAFSAQSALAADTTAVMVSVEYIGVNPALASIDAQAPFISGDIRRSLLGGDPAFEDAFLLRPQMDLTLEFYPVIGLTPEGVPVRGEALATHPLRKGSVYLFRHHVPEGMPNLVVCAKTGKDRLCWTPRFSGMDGSVELDPGFALFNKDGR